MAIKQSEVKQTPLTVAEMWRAWPAAKLKSPNSEEEKEEIFQKRLEKLSLEVPKAFPEGERTTFVPSSPRALAASKQLRITKLAIYEDVLSFYHQEKDRKMFLKRWEELHGKEVEGYNLDVRLKRANEGKDSANTKYLKEKNWFGAMYTYAIAWGCLMPYYPEALASTDNNQMEMGKFEGAIWSNLAACVITGSETKIVEKSQRAGMIQLGLRAALVCMAMNEYITVGVMQKACNRAVKLRGMLQASEHQSTDEEAAIWAKQAELIDGVEAKIFFKDVEEAKRVIKPKVGGLKAARIV